jgi:hypothetical protein
VLLVVIFLWTRPASFSLVAELVCSEPPCSSSCVIFCMWFYFAVTISSRVDYQDNVGASTSHNSMGLHGLLQGKLYFFLVKFELLAELVVKSSGCGG